MEVLQIGGTGVGSSYSPQHPQFLKILKEKNILNEENNMKKNFLPNEKVWACRFKAANYENGALKNSHCIGIPVYGIVACEREKRYHEKAVGNGDVRVKYFIPFKEGTTEPDWERPRHIETGLYFAETKEECRKILNKLIQNAIDDYNKEINYLKQYLS